MRLIFNVTFPSFSRVIRDVYKSTGELIDPHTAVGVHADHADQAVVLGGDGEDVLARGVAGLAAGQEAFGVGQVFYGPAGDRFGRRFAAKVTADPADSATAPSGMTDKRKATSINSKRRGEICP